MKVFEQAAQYLCATACAPDETGSGSRSVFGSIFLCCDTLRTYRMAIAQSGARVFGEKHAINYARTLAFFEARGSIAERNPLTATMYQGADLASSRDRAEKET